MIVHMLLALLALSLLGASPGSADIRIGVATPLTGVMAWAGAATQKGAELAVADLNRAGGILRERIALVAVDDYCDGEQAVAAANKLVEDNVAAVFGHECSGAAIPASKIYARAGVLMISTFATNPELTEQGLDNVFRTIGRDDIQGAMAGSLLAERFSGKRIGILHDGGVYGKGLASEAKKRLNALGVTEVNFAAIEPGKSDYSELVRKMRAMDVQVLYYAGYREGALILRQAHDRDYNIQFLGGDSVGLSDFALIAGDAAEGELFTYPPEPSTEAPKAAALAARISTDLDLHTSFSVYAAVQTWAQAVEKAGTLETEAVAAVLRAHEFDTVLGRIGFNDKGDVTGFEPFAWYVWKDGKFVPLDEKSPKTD
jgi:branched-chain amino acid transport system substrate-binding protein